MCDILVATPRATREGVTIFAKNSDREPNEAQVLEFIPRRRFEGEYVELTNTRFPSVRETYAVLIARPWWIYGAEMGVNEYGLAIGNVAVFTKEPYVEKGLLGMDMLRLALERTRTAREALKFLIELIEGVGQGGNYSYERRFRYHNSFIIVDQSEAWVLETVGRYWAAKRIDDVYSVSNALTITSAWDMAHDELVKHGVSRHGCSKDSFNFAECYSDKLFTKLARARERREFTYKQLRRRVGEITVWDMLEILRSHYEEPYHPAKGSMRDICMHYGGLLRPSQTASSMIAVVKPSKQLILVTGASNPCLSMYKPILLGVEIPFKQTKTTNRFDPEDYWWKHEVLHRKLQLCYTEFVHKYREEVLELEKNVVKQAVELFFRNQLDEKKALELLSQALKSEEEVYSKWGKVLAEAKCRPPLLYKLRISRINRKAGVET